MDVAHTKIPGEFQDSFSWPAERVSYMDVAHKKGDLRHLLLFNVKQAQ